ncbi:MAG: dehydratase [Chloroflexi bacterium]|uniref:Dehydratase n=1 Tax=Candidatus Chlorohelix allophototropha TaxID=3003348 RepID=A0A8T7LYH8_9CHLR|nr:dehydratase [Chloroflexota bacterium]WJW67848.1 MaoC family dehydratase N-terminal domain-containing protein [Chloroflexota bacterium L227-S17]
MNKLYFEDVQIGDQLPSLTKAPVTHVQLVRYAGASGDFNPLHTDSDVGKAVGIGGTIAHGMLIMGFVGQMVSDYLGDPTNLRRFRVRFQNMTRLGDVITCSGYVVSKYEEAGKGYIEAQVQAVDATGDRKVAGSFIATLSLRALV